MPRRGHVLGEAGQPADRTAGLGDERAAPGDPLQEPSLDQRVHRLADGHPGDPELGTSSRSEGAGGRHSPCDEDRTYSRTCDVLEGGAGCQHRPQGAL